ncbi:MAG: hypothetical protein HON23_04455 [Rickettsiales bacterium]|jgi:hypothetical protein|nr:hypothetical protein [Rickettsiales bacterium]
MIKSFTLGLTLISLLFTSNMAFAFNDIDEERYMLQYSINSDKETSVKFDYRENDINSSNILDRRIDHLDKQDQLNYSGYKNVQGYKNTNKRNSKRFAGIAIGVIVTGVVLAGMTVAAIVGAL